MARTHNPRKANLGGGLHGTRTRECACGNRITTGGPWTQHVRSCTAAQEAEAEREAARILRDLGSNQ